MDKLVSVIIPTTDKEKEILKECVEAIKNSSYKNVEIIVVNEGKERSEQRNIGIARAKGDYLLILDSDQIVSWSLIEECVNSIFLFSGLYIPEKIVTKGFFGYLRNWERQFYTGTAIDCVRFVHRYHCPLFDTSMHGPEDSDWDRRIGSSRKIVRSKLYHKDNIGFINYLKKKAYYSKSMKRFADKWPDDKCLNFWWRCLFVFIEQGKWKRLLARPDLTICLFGLIILRGVIYLRGKNAE